MLENNWRLVVSKNWAVPTKGVLPFTIPFLFKSQIIKVETAITNVPASWYKAGYYGQATSIVPLVEIASRPIALNRQKLIVFPTLGSNYWLIFTPSRWLPAGLRLRVWQYNGAPPTADLFNQFYLID